MPFASSLSCSLSAGAEPVAFALSAFAAERRGALDSAGGVCAAGADALGAAGVGFSARFGSSRAGAGSGSNDALPVFGTAESLDCGGVGAGAGGSTG
jgi:hypothetical protein